MHSLKLLFLIITFSLSTLGSAAPLAPTNLPDLVEKILPGVVNISSSQIQRSRRGLPQGLEDYFQFWGMPQDHKQTSLGSGFLIDATEGLVITNNHVVENADEVLVTLVDKRVFKAKILGKDQKMDLALLKLREKTGPKAPSGLTAVPTGDSDLVRIAESVFAVGNPFGLQHTVTMGIVSAKNRTIGVGPFDNFLQTDASINPGNSGGPLFNLKGEVIGINTVIFSKTGQSGGLGFAIPVNELKRILPDLKRYGRVPRPWLGVLGQGLTPQMASYYDLPIEKGVIIVNLVRQAPADLGGILAGDIIVSVDGTQVANNNDIEKILFSHKPGETIQIKIQRDQKAKTLSIKTTELPRLENLPQGII